MAMQQRGSSFGEQLRHFRLRVGLSLAALERAAAEALLEASLTMGPAF